MSLQYHFDPLPQYFRKHGWLKPKPNGDHHLMATFLMWTFGRCSSKPQVVYHDHKEMLLEPFEFIFGRRMCSVETGISERHIRTIIDQLNSGVYGKILEKSTSKSTSKFTVYKWSTAILSENIDQQTDQQPTSNRPATDHKQEQRTKDPEEPTTPKPPNPKKDVVVVFYDCLSEVNVPQATKQTLMKYPETRVKLAVDFIMEPGWIPNISLEHTLVWHCKQHSPPAHAQKPCTPEVKMAVEHNQIYVHYYPQIYADNILSINEGYMNVWCPYQPYTKNGFSRISLKNSLKDIMNDIKEAALLFNLEKSRIDQEKHSKIEAFA